MTEPPIKPARITKPIQLLGAWLAGLFSIDSCFLFAASNLPQHSWEASALVVAAIANVPLFLLAVFVLQTKFRPEMQEDSYYATYLNSKTNEVVKISKDDAQFSQLKQMIGDLESKIVTDTSAVNSGAVNPISTLSIGVNKFLTDRKEIGQKLSELGVIGFTSFGAKEPPTRRSVAISQYLPHETVSAVVSVARTLGFSYYTLFDNRAEEIAEDVLFGNYGADYIEIAGA